MPLRFQALKADNHARAYRSAIVTRNHSAILEAYELTKLRIYERWGILKFVRFVEFVVRKFEAVANSRPATGPRL